jgi:alpha/beta hydrolase family protein
MWQGMHVTGTTTPSAFLRTAGRMRTAAVAERVRADVLLLQGAEDHDVPVEQMHRQAMTLRHARSLTTRTFTAAESCASHCQVGNIGLAIRTMLEWETAVSPMSSASSASSTSGLDSTDGL